MQFKFILPVSTKFLCSVCFLTRPVFGHLCDYIAHTKKQHNMATPSMTLKLGGFQQGDGVFHIKALAFACPRTRSAGSHVFHSTRIVPDSAAALRGLLTKWPIMAFCSIHQAYRPPLLVWFYKPLFKTLCLIGWSRETPLLPKSSCGPKVSKRSIFADLLKNIHFLGLSTNLQNSEDLQSPPLAQLCTTTRPWLICQKAFRLACWLAEQGLA